MSHPATTVERARRVRPRIPRSTAVAEVIGLVMGVLGIMWLEPVVPHPQQARTVAIAVLGLLLIWRQWREAPGRRELGLSCEHLGGVLLRLFPLLASFVGVVTLIGWLTDALRFGPRFWSMLGTVPLWALLQQYLLLGFVHRRLRVIFANRRSAVIVTACLFGLMHLPNPTLAVACTLGGYCWAREFDRSPNLFANALTHTIASAFLANTLPRFLLKNMAVGYHYLVT